MKVTAENLKTTLNGEIYLKIFCTYFYCVIKTFFDWIARTKDIDDMGGKMPTSCKDLELMGQKIGGIFLVKGLKNINAVFCDFNPNTNNGNYEHQLFGNYSAQFKFLKIRKFRKMDWSR